MNYRTALITGASSGIGRALALTLAREGTHVVLCARRESELSALRETITGEGGRATVAPVDVSDAEAIVRTVREADEALAGLELVVANAGIGGVTPARSLRWESITAMCQVNFNGAIATLTAVLPQMVARKRGHLVGVSSLAALAPLPGSATYGATKAGLSMFLAGLRMDLAGSGVDVTTVHPGFVRTPMTATNAFPMPFLVECDEAARHIARRLPQRPALIDFPRELTTAARLYGALPRPVQELAARAQRFVR